MVGWSRGVPWVLHGPHLVWSDADASPGRRVLLLVVILQGHEDDSSGGNKQVRPPHDGHTHAYQPNLHGASRS